MPPCAPGFPGFLHPVICKAVPRPRGASFGAVPPVPCPKGECHGAKVPSQGQALLTGRGAGVGLSGTALCPIGTALRIVRGPSWCPGWGQPGSSSPLHSGKGLSSFPGDPGDSPARAHVCHHRAWGNWVVSVPLVTGRTAQRCPGTPWPWADVSATANASGG